MPTSIEAIIRQLEDALDSEADLGQRIKAIQDAVWASPGDEHRKNEWGVLRELAYDLDFFVSDPKHRMEDASYFGEDRARDEIRSALDRLRSQERAWQAG